MVDDEILDFFYIVTPYVRKAQGEREQSPGTVPHEQVLTEKVPPYVCCLITDSKSEVRPSNVARRPEHDPVCCREVRRICECERDLSGFWRVRRQRTVVPFEACCSRWCE